MFKKKTNPQPTQAGSPSGAEPKAGDELFEALSRSKKAKRRKRVRTLLILLVLAAVALVAGISILRRQVRERFAGEAQEVQSQQATRGTVSTLVSGSGMLLNVDTETVSVPAGVEVTEILVSFGDQVQAGQLLAVADMTTVRSAMAQIQESIEDLDDQISDAEGDKVSSYVSAGVSGRVKRLCAQEGMSVEDAMVDRGCLAVISLDGFLGVDIQTQLLAEGDAVTVLLPDGEETQGSVSAVVGDRATVLISDDGPEVDREVTVLLADGREAGTGSLYIHNPLKITGYAGTVKNVRAKLNQKVYANTTLFTLTDTSTTASYDALLRSRSEMEEVLLQLLQIQRYGGPVSPISGSIYSVTDLDTLEETETETETQIVTVSPDTRMSVTISVDESDILSLELDQTAEVTVSSVSEDTLPGTVTEIDKTDSSGAYTAVITLDKVSGMIPGMTASVDVRIQGVDNAIVIPAEALHQTSQGYYVYTAYDEETETFGGRVDVIPGLSNDNYVEIKSGLEEGDTVYYTESQDFFGMMGFGNMSSGETPGFSGSGGGMPDFSGGGMPDFSGGGARPDFSGSGRPSGMPGGMPGDKG